MKYMGWERKTDVKINSTPNLQLTATEEVGKTEVLEELNNKLLQRRNSQKIPSQIENFYNTWRCFCRKLRLKTFTIHGIDSLSEMCAERVLEYPFPYYGSFVVLVTLKSKRKSQTAIA